MSTENRSAGQITSEDLFTVCLQALDEVKTNTSVQQIFGSAPFIFDKVEMPSDGSEAVAVFNVRQQHPETFGWNQKIRRMSKTDLTIYFQYSASQVLRGLSSGYGQQNLNDIEAAGIQIPPDRRVFMAALLEPNTPALLQTMAAMCALNKIQPHV